MRFFFNFRTLQFKMFSLRIQKASKLNFEHKMLAKVDQSPSDFFTTAGVYNFTINLARPRCIFQYSVNLWIFQSTYKTEPESVG